MKLLLLGLLTLFLFSCSDDVITEYIPIEADHASITLNGGGYNNETFTLEKNSSTSFTESAYDKGTGLTQINIYDFENKRSFNIAFRGVDISTTKWRDTNHSLKFYPEDSLYFLATIKTDVGETKITKYGIEGGKIEGTFNGIMLTDNHREIQITGSFAVTRFPDIEVIIVPEKDNATIVLNGGRYNNQTFIVEKDSDVTASESFYDPNTDLTQIQIFNFKERGSFYIRFKGKFIGTTNWANIYHTMTFYPEKDSSYPLTPTFEDLGEVQITKYEDEGGRIEGTFKGNLFIDSSFGNELQMSGSFSVLRFPDMEKIHRDSDYISINFNGGDFNNETFIIEKDSNYWLSISRFTPDYDFTEIRIYDFQKQRSLNILFQGTDIGTTQWTHPFFRMRTWMPDRYGDLFDTQWSEIGQLKITKYENVGGRIEGTFNGLLLTDSRWRTAQKIKMFGSFSVKRHPDRVFGSPHSEGQWEKNVKKIIKKVIE